MPRKSNKKNVFRATPEEIRIYVAAFFTLVFAAIIVLRLLYIQVWEKNKYAQMADKQYIIEIPVAAQRGLIYDRNMEYLALNEPCVSIGLDKRQMAGTSREYAQKLARVLKVNSGQLRKRISSVKGNFVWLQRRIDVEFGPRIAALNLPGVRVERDTRRIYPHQEIASHILGFTDPDNKGLEGVELQFNSLLTGKNGRVVIQRDGRGRAVPENIVEHIPPRDGKAIVLTIDYIIQTIATEELRKAAREYHARNGIVVVCEPQTGEILAIANAPSYNPNDPAKYTPAMRRNKAVTDVYEPGSTFKIVLFSSMLEKNAKQVNDLVFCENGIYRHEGRTIRDVKKYGWLTVGDVLKNSSNIGTVKLAQELGGELLYEMLQAYGFGQKTNIDLPGETPGIVNEPKNWTNFSLASIAFGQEISVSALQMAMAFAAIANGGKLLTPHLMHGVLDEQGNFVGRQKEPEGKRVISTKTANVLTKLLVNVVEDGTGEPAKIAGLRVAGKTGTGQKALPNGKGYSATEFISNFAGFFPADHPKYMIYVMLDTDYRNQWGKYAAATFKRIAQRIQVQEKRLYSKMTSTPKTNQHSEPPREIKNFVMPNLVNRKYDFGRNVLEALGLNIEEQGRGEFILSQSIAAGTKIAPGEQVVLELFEVKKSDGRIIMPSVIGLSLREALSQLAIHNLEPVVYGHGQVRNQKPSPGSLVRAGARSVIECVESKVPSPVLRTPSRGKGILGVR
jgi:stage V sporulation protein D (sporulation-specific penicillin-binding protein)